jgi:hypothetical protein
MSITITNAGLNLIRDGMKGADNSLISYVALGTGNTSPTTSDTSLQTEVFRKAVTSYVNGSTGEITIILYIAPNDAIGVVIAEIGFFGGNSASSAANSGVLLARGLYSHTKTNLESIQAQIDFTL